MKQNKKKSILNILVLPFMVLLLAGVVGCANVQLYISSETTDKEADDDVLYSGDTSMSAEEFYASSGTLVSVIEAGDSTEVHTEAETSSSFTERGFLQYPIVTEVSMTGDIIDELEITGFSADKHPMYTTYYVTKSGNLWTIMDINGHIYANPVFYNLAPGNRNQVLLSETNTVLSYDPESNKFFETVPDKDVLNVITVDLIDSDTLEKMTSEEIDRNA